MYGMRPNIENELLLVLAKMVLSLRIIVSSHHPDTSISHQTYLRTCFSVPNIKIEPWQSVFKLITFMSSIIPQAILRYILNLLIFQKNGFWLFFKKSDPFRPLKSDLDPKSTHIFFNFGRSKGGSKGSMSKLWVCTKGQKLKSDQDILCSNS